MSGTEVDPRERVQAIRAEAGHPIIDCDGHMTEFLPDLMPFIKKAGVKSENSLRELVAIAAWGRTLATPGAHMWDWAKMSKEERARKRVARPSSQEFARSMYDRATATLPELMYERLDEIGIDFAIVYPSFGLQIASIEDERIRRAACHGFNEYCMDLFRDLSDRLTPPAAIPMHTPEEAVGELEHAHSLGFKLALIPAYVRRYDHSIPRGLWFDAFGLDSKYDYDAVWAKTTELGMPVSGHGGAYGDGWLNRQSISSFSFNHIGHFATAQEFLCRSLFMGGVTRRFPQQRFSFLEGGVAWAAMLYSSAISHWEKRKGEALQGHLTGTSYQPSDLEKFQGLVKRYGGKLLERTGTAVLDRAEEWFYSSPGEGGPEDDEWAAVGISSKQDFIDRFVVPFAFGAEADDPMTATAVMPSNPLGARLTVLFSSDMGHFDVPDLLGILDEAHEGVEDGWMTREDFRDFAFGNAARFLTDMNPDFFTGTKVEGAVKELLAG